MKGFIGNWNYYFQTESIEKKYTKISVRKIIRKRIKYSCTILLAKLSAFVLNTTAEY